MPTHFLSSYFRAPGTAKQTSFQSSYIFSEQHRLYWNGSRYLKQLLFRKRILFKRDSCLEQLLLSKNFFLVTNTFSDQLLLEDKYFFSTATASEKLLFQNKELSRTYTFSEEELFRSRYFLKTVTFSEKLVLRNQVHNIYTWKNVPLTSTNSLKYTMIWSDFELPQSFIVENSKQCINFNTYVLQMWFFRKLIVIVVSSNKLRKIVLTISIVFTVRKVSKYGLISGPYLDTFHA